MVLGKKLITLITADYLYGFFLIHVLLGSVARPTAYRRQRTRKNVHLNSNGHVSKGFLAGSRPSLPAFAYGWVSFLFRFTYVCKKKVFEHYGPVRIIAIVKNYFRKINAVY